MTITLSDGLLPFFLAGIVVGAGLGLAAVVRRLWVPGVGAAGGLRLAAYLLRYGTALEYHGFRRAEIDDHVDGLRADLTTAVDGGLVAGEVSARFGTPRRLAAAVAEGELRPSWLRGSLWFGAGLLGSLFVLILVTEAFLGGFEPHAGAGDTGSWSLLGLGVEATMGDDGRASTIGFTSWWIVVLPLAGFLLGSRIWRLRSSAAKVLALV